MSENKSIGGLWEKETKSGKVLSGSIEVNGQKVRIAIWPNKYKTETKHPDFRIFVDNYEPKPKANEPESDLPF